MMGFTPKQQTFINEYLKCFNATKAALAAGYSDKTAYSIGHENLKKPEIASEIERIYRENTMSAGEVLYHLSQIARGDFADITNTAGAPDILKASDLGKSNLIRKIKSKTIIQSDKDGEGTETHEEEVEIYDRLKALELLAKYHDLINKSTVRVADWRDEVIQLLREGKVTTDEVAEELGVSLAEELFKSAGIRTISGG